MPQTRFVLRKALELQKRVVVVVNKIDRPAARPDWVIDSTFELFMDLGASDELCEFPVVYASGAWCLGSAGRASGQVWAGGDRDHGLGFRGCWMHGCVGARLRRGLCQRRVGVCRTHD